MVDKLLAPFKILPVGWYRLIIVCSIIISLLIVGVLIQDVSFSINSGGELNVSGKSIQFSDVETADWMGNVFGVLVFVSLFVFGQLIFWILAGVALWVYKGFKNDKTIS